MRRPLYFTGWSCLKDVSHDLSRLHITSLTDKLEVSHHQYLSNLVCETCILKYSSLLKGSIKYYCAVYFEVLALCQNVILQEDLFWVVSTFVCTDEGTVQNVNVRVNFSPSPTNHTKVFFSPYSKPSVLLALFYKFFFVSLVKKALVRRYYDGVWKK